MTRSLKHRRWVCLLGLLGPSTHATAGPYTDLIVFGDSLSDVGNTLSSVIADVFVETDDFQNRFSNGPVYSERLSQGLGLGPLTRSGAFFFPGDNFAYGGAETDGPNDITAPFVDSLVEQVDDYLGRVDGAVPDPGALFVVFIGANDFLLAGQTDVAVPAGVVHTQLDRLADAGAEQILGINLPLLGITPSRLGDTALSDRASAYNQALASVYDDLESTHPDVTLHRLDVETLFSDLIDNADAFGFTNVTEPGQDLPGSSFDRAPGYLFWDGVHPTREAHALLGEAAIRAVLPEGDYNRDGQVTAADYTTWATQFGVRFDAAAGLTPSLAGDANGDGRINAADYTLWRDRITIGAGALPEPSTAGLLAVLFFLRWGRRGSPVG